MRERVFAIRGVIFAAAVANGPDYSWDCYGVVRRLAVVRFPNPRLKGGSLIVGPFVLSVMWA